MVNDLGRRLSAELGCQGRHEDYPEKDYSRKGIVRPPLPCEAEGEVRLSAFPRGFLLESEVGKQRQGKGNHCQGLVIKSRVHLLHQIRSPHLCRSSNSLNSHELTTNNNGAKCDKQ